MRFELMTSSLPRRRSTPELRGQRARIGAGDEIRTRDPQLGRLMLYQLSYTRPRIANCEMRISNLALRQMHVLNSKSAFRNPQFFPGAGGRIRTCVGREPAGFTARCH